MRIYVFLISFLFYGFLLNAQEVKLEKVSKLLPVNHIRYQSSIKHQGVKFTCTAFAIAAALETFPNVPKDLSEKYLYALQKGYQFGNEKITIGHKLSFYPKSLIKDGVIEEKYLPYSLNYEKVRPMNESQFDDYLYEGEIGLMTLITKYRKKAIVYVKDYEYLNINKVKNIEYIKKQLRDGVKAIPVSYTPLYIPAWKENPSRFYKTITPDAGFKVKVIGNYYSYSQAKKILGKNLNKMIIEGTISVEMSHLPNNYGGHAVAIVGYDSEGFIIKNSYGTQWRVGGYERISYDFHQVFAIEALIIRKVKVKNKFLNWLKF